MTKQLKDFKVGDKVIIEGTVSYIDEDGDYYWVESDYMDDSFTIQRHYPKETVVKEANKND